MALQLEQYLDNLETLPVEMKRNFNLMKDLDQRSLNSLQKIDTLVHGYLANAKNLPADKRTKQTKEIEDNFVKAKSFCDDKVTLAQQTYDMVDKHIRRLDNDLARFEGQLKQRLLAENKGNQKKRKRADDHAQAGGGRRKKLDMKQFEDEMPRISDKKKKKQLVELKQVPSVDPMSLCNLSGQALIQTLASAAGDVLDMPVDPNEPTYCLCHQVSYGEMIGCDNEDCPIEWFHFGCVGLSNKPKGKWYCPRCSDSKKKK